MRFAFVAKQLVDELSSIVGTQIVESRTRWHAGGGATLTKAGKELVASYFALVADLEQVAGPALLKIKALSDKSRM